ncbi:hypothetical protein A3Q56_00617 [Intoshia linei]|uniref:Replication protein A subunit n=1 Tax=Intoshia linei TaxID=1819745 RepID=A0A177BD71_9BILA|nr:hypothetical protein A3Q56_00617 [Intoshia linei]
MRELLAPGSIEKIVHNGERVDNLVLQYISCKDFVKRDFTHRVTLSDSLNKCDYFCLRKGCINDGINIEDVEKNSLVRIESYKLNKNQKTNLMVVSISEMTVLNSPNMDLIGIPTSLAKNKETKPTNGTNISSNGFNFNSVSTRVDEISEPNPKKTKLNDLNSKKYELINNLTPYQQTWTICGRVTMKSNIKTFSNNSGPGKLFSFVLSDQSGEIRCTCFTKPTDKYFDTVQVNKVFTITKAAVRPANKKFSNLANDYEITFNDKTELLAVDDAESSKCPLITYNFISFGNLLNNEANTHHDVIGIIHNINDCVSLTSKNGKELTKRDLILVDDTNYNLKCTIWGEDAKNFSSQTGDIIIIRAAKLSDFGGRSISGSFNSTISFDDDIPEAKSLKQWYDEVGSTTTFVDFSSENQSFADNYHTIDKILTLSNTQKTEYVNVVCTVSIVRDENAFYKSCPATDCMKKVTELDQGQYRCEKCDKEYDSFDYCYLLNVNLMDHTGSIWARMFRESAEMLMECKASVLGKLNIDDAEEQSEFNGYFQRALNKEYNFKLRLRMESYQDEFRLNTVVLTMRDVNYRETLDRYLNILA